MKKKRSAQDVDKILTLGADPEFVLVQGGGSLKHASSVIRGGLAAKFGVDGGSVAVEIRPSPSTDPAKVVESIQDTLKAGAKKYPESLLYKWHAGGNTVHPIGGHIHFGTMALNEDSWSNMQPEESALAKALDRFLAIPLLAIEDKGEARSRRVQSHYGQLSDWRAQNWGCEYRTPGSWITSPAVSLAVLSLAKVVACESLAGLITARDLFRIPIQSFRDACIGPRMTDKAWRRIEKMAMYPKYAKAIGILQELTKAGKTWQAGDMKDSWHLLTPRMIAKMKEPAASRGNVKLSEVWSGTRPTLYRVTRRHA
jgi:hypothetical protein